MRIVTWLFAAFVFVESLVVYGMVEMSGPIEIRIVCSIIWCSSTCWLLYLTYIECKRFKCFIIFLYKNKGCLRPWYDNLNLKQRIIIWCVTVLLSLFPIIGWFLISPWLIVLLYCEYKRPSKKVVIESSILKLY
jgi:hypothetical protein